jgi:hypothetical protein
MRQHLPPGAFRKPGDSLPIIEAIPEKLPPATPSVGRTRINVEGNALADRLGCDDDLRTRRLPFLGKILEALDIRRETGGLNRPVVINRASDAGPTMDAPLAWWFLQLIDAHHLTAECAAVAVPQLFKRFNAARIIRVDNAGARSGCSRLADSGATTAYDLRRRC